MARLMAAAGAQVVGVDFCETFLDRARKRTAPEAPVEYRWLDATDPDQLRTLGAARFHGAVATMAHLLSIALLRPLLAVALSNPAPATSLPWAAAATQYQKATPPSNFLDMLLNAAYNQGYYGDLVPSYSRQGASATAATAASVRAFSRVWGDSSTYDQYPYQVMYYLDQLYDNPIPTTSATTFTTPRNHVAVPMAALGAVFAGVMETLAYQDGAGQYGFISAAQAGTAFSNGLSWAGVNASATLDLASATGRARIFSVLENAFAALEANLGMKFNATTRTQL